MSRRLMPLLSAAALVAVACQDIQQPPVHLEVSDGSVFGGNQNPYFFFLPPIVPSPEYSGVFDPSLLPFLRIEVWRATPTTPLQCGAGNLVDSFDASDGLAVDPVAQQYAFSWNTPRSLMRDEVHRLCVILEVSGVGTQTLGFRDIEPTQGGGSVAEDPVYLFNLGSNLAIKFRVEEGVLSDAFCTGGTGDLDYDCTAQFLASNETALCQNETCSLTTGILNEEELFLIEKFGISNPRCFEDDGTSVDGFPLPIDIPQWAGCVRITVFDDVGSAAFEGFLNNSFGTVGACFYPTSGPPIKNDEEQAEAIQLHIHYPDNNQPDGDPTVWALPWGPTGGIVDECLLAETPPPAGIGGQIARAAGKVWRHTQKVLNPWFAPPPVYAFHTGFGGHTTLNSDEGGLLPPGGLVADEGLLRADAAVTDVSGPTANQTGGPQVFYLLWALPSQMAATQFCGGAGCSGVATQPLTLNLGVPVQLTIRVTDNGAVDDATFGRVLGPTPRAVEGATVRITDSDGGSQVATTPEDGEVQYSFTPSAIGSSSITVRGFGIGTTNGPFDAFNASGQYVQQASLLDWGELTFNVRVCEPGPTVDGVVNVAGNEYPNLLAAWTAVTVNLGGNVSGTAYLHVTNDCDNLYLTFLMPSDNSKDNQLRLVFAQDGDPAGGISEGPFDDVLSLSAAGFRDRYLSQACVGSKQADCGPDDPDRPKDGAGVATYQSNFTTPFLGKTAWYVYEMRHPLRSNGSPYDLNLLPGTTVYYYGAVSLGGGSKGNSEFPDQKGNFKNYGLTYTVK